MKSTLSIKLLVFTALVFAACAPPDQMSEPIISVHESYAEDSEGDMDEDFGSEEYADEVVEAEMAAPREAPAESQFNRESYDQIVENNFFLTKDESLSTFSIDVDTASYSNLRRTLNQGNLPPAGLVRIEEMVNYFDYSYAGPTGDAPFAVADEVFDSPWTKGNKLVRIAIKGKEVSLEQRPAANLVFLLDVSGSMDEPNKLPLLVRSLKLLTEELRADDKIAIVVYAGSSGLVLESTSDKGKIKEALERLSAGGSTNGGEGLTLAYRVAARNFVEGGINRVIMASDGDWNTGVTSQSGVLDRIHELAAKGISLSVLGFGMGNYNDSMMEKLADQGNGNYAYIDTFSEARKVLVEQMSGTLLTIAKDVKIQVEFNPQHVKSFRLIGYENRVMDHQDFADDKKDAGDIGAGHTVTALYEIEPQTAPQVAAAKSLRYQTGRSLTPAAATDEILSLKIRYKDPDGAKSKLMTTVIRRGDRSFETASVDARFQTSVAGFGMLLRNSKFKGDLTYENVAKMAEASFGQDKFGYRKEFLDLVTKASRMRR